MIKNFVTRPLFTLAIFIVLFLVGMFGFLRLPLDFLPNISIPTLTIITPYPGASAEDIETTVSKVIEDSVSTVANIDKITSDSQENLSIVTISFKWGQNLDAASADVRDKMDLIRNKLPDDIQPSTVFKFDLSQIPILVVGLTAGQSYDQLYELADKQIVPALKRVAGVGTVNVNGGLQRQINVDLDRQRLESYHLSLNQVSYALQTANLSLPAGSFKGGQLEYGVRVPGEFQKVDEINQVIVGAYGDKDVFLSDVATVVDSFVEPTNMTEINGQPGITLQIQKQSGANTVQVAAAARAELARIMTTLPPDLKLIYVQDTSESILNTINELSRTLYYAFFFIFLSILFFLRNVRGAFIVSLAMPVSLIAAFLYMFFTGVSINIISLASLIISIGVVVDDAIVVLENIYRHRDKKHEPPQEAAIYGAGEVSGAVIASTTTNLVIFLPLLLVSGFIGIFFNQLSLITIVVIATSLLTAISLTPMLCSKLLTIRKKEESGRGGWWNSFYDRSEAAFESVEEAYGRTLAWTLSRRRLVITTCALLFVFSLPLFVMTGSEFFPDEDDGNFQGTVEMPAGTRWEATAAAMRRIQAEAKKQLPELIYVMVSAGAANANSSMGGKNGPNYGRIVVKAVPLEERKRGEKDLQRVIAGIAQSIPGLKSISFTQSGANALSGADKPVTVELYGNDFDQLDSVAQDLLARMKKVPGVVDPGVSREKTNPEYAINVNREKAASLGLSVYDVAMATRGYIYGNAVTKYREGGDEYDIYLRLRPEDRRGLEDVKSAFVTTRTGQNVALGNLADLELKSGPQMIQRKNQQRMVIVNSDFFGRSLGDVVSDVRKILNKTAFPPGVTYKVTGSAEQMQESFQSLFVALLLGICLIYLVMVAQFESFFEPFVVMFAIPFGLIGVIWALFLTGKPFGVMPFIGLIMVTGVAVKTSIVLVDYINILRARGLEIKEAILLAGKTRLRPILMTSITTLLGLMPIVLGRGEGSAFWKTMAIGVVGGILVSGAITLFFVPALYYVLESRLRQAGRRS